MEWTYNWGGKGYFSDQMRQHIIQQGCLFFYCISFCLSSPLSFSPKSHVPRKWVFWELSLWLLWAARGSDSLDLTPRCLSIAGSFLHLVSVPLSLWQQELPPPSPLLQHTHSLPISHLYTTHEYSFGGGASSFLEEVLIIIIIAWKLQLWNIMWLTEWTEAQLLFLE